MSMPTVTSIDSPTVGNRSGLPVNWPWPVASVRDVRSTLLA